jgi:hypothetical protein
MDRWKEQALKGQSKETDMDELRVLIAYSSVHGSTAEIARALALTLCRTGFDVDVVPVAEVQDVSGYDSVVLGSAVYGGKWRKDALEFLDRFTPVLSHRDIWLFQSGPLGHSAQYIVRALPANVALMAEYLGIRVSRPSVADWTAALVALSPGSSRGPVSPATIETSARYAGGPSRWPVRLR